MKISVLSHDLSHNCLGRAYLLAQLLERNYEVEIVGPTLGDEIWLPVQGEYDYKSVDTTSYTHSFARAVPKLLDLIEGDVILASKPRVQSYGVALIKRLREHRPVILDIDDWESGFAYGPGKLFGKLFAYSLGIPKGIKVDSFYYYRTLEAFAGRADARIVSNHFLQEKFGGEIIPHVRDTDVFNSERFDTHRAREEFDLPSDAHLIMFSGTPRPHKGVEDLVRAVSSLGRDGVCVVLVGAHESDYVERLRRIGGDSLIVRGQQPFDQIPKWIAAADVITIPQRRIPGTEGQIPAKVFDAMAMGKPIVATNVSDLPTVLDDCGVIVEPESVPQLAKAIAKLIENEDYRQELGRRARERSVMKYSYDAAAPQIADVIESL
ncbi:glycosyltransferase family 4 protein [Natrarchaeobius chitinivorans]|uniref:Glycosyltransferase n=1 Tax=Natrarchaeobius chitinivorans TaxID=1679083 RepID=A0A3N6MNI8_NATCH|nr:glycosyltransferase family 4 protein [Natrarchaeobius chitinivorans]RQG96046.1 glycosyltransferase [Natrarchaeobius chitinivorans]